MIFKNNSLDFAQNYNLFILDVWGVIHDGTTTYPGVVERLVQLKKLGKKICFLSNAPRRSNKVAEVLLKYGITSDLYDAIITSGEATYLYLQENQENNFAKFSKNYFYIGPQKDMDLLDGLKYQMTEANSASFIIATGFDHDLSTLAEKLPQLREAIKYKLPMICVNPDLIVIKQNGQEMICAGVMANEYKRMGGEVIYFGKPYNSVYKQVFQLFSIQDKTKVIAIGDGIETDILGAHNFGIDNALIPGGILSNKLKVKYGELPIKQDLERVCHQYHTFPKFIIAGL
jgi:HAD superfamily hydrolase (TIGR01459 family)